LSTDASFVTRSKQEDWLPILELAVEEVFAIMLGCRVKPVAKVEHPPKGDYTALVSMAGSLCGTLTVCCDAKAASDIAEHMLADASKSEDQIGDALGELCNMIAGNFKNKLSGLDERCMLSVPAVISGGAYRFRPLAAGSFLETVMLFKSLPVAMRLQLQQ
jgi:chemotaxis protein CheX